MLIKTCNYHGKAIAVLLLTLLFAGCSCKSKVITVTGTTVGLEASPGDTTNGQPPSVMFGYRRAEAAIVPVLSKEPGATTEKSNPPKAREATSQDPTKEQTNSPSGKTDAFSVLATFNLALNWFGPAKIEQFIATGHAAREIQSSVLKKMAGANDALASKFKDLQSNDPDGGCWRAIQIWRTKNLSNITEKDFVEDPRYADKRMASWEDSVVKNACLTKSKPQ